MCSKKKSSDTSTIYDILLHQSNNEFKIISTKKPDYILQVIICLIKIKIKWKIQFLILF